MTEQPSYARDIRPLFRESDIRAMAFAFDLGSLDDVRANADGIYERLAGGEMPCDGAWPAEDIAAFAAGSTQACPPDRVDRRGNLDWPQIVGRYETKGAKWEQPCPTRR